MKKLPFINSKGAAAVEFALILPVLLLLVLGIIEFSTIIYNQAVLTNASREGARAGIVDGPDRLTEEEIGDVVLNYLGSNLLNLGGTSDPAVSASGAQGGSGSELIVDVSYMYDFLVLPAFAESLAGGLNLTARTVMRME